MILLSAMIEQFAPWLIGATVAVFGLLGWRRSIRKDMARETAMEAAERRNHTLTEARRHEAEAETQDDPALVDRLTRR